MEITDTDLKILVQQLTAFENMYQHIRIIEPFGKKVIYRAGVDLSETEDACYGIWERSEACKNCISVRAYQENETFIKIDHTNHKVIMVTSIPMVFKGEKVAVELIKDVTKSMVLEEQMRNSQEIKRLLDIANEAAVTDELTRVYNKRFIMEKLPTEIVQANSKGEPLSVIMADIDHFKRINDTYGHLAGDSILREFAQVMKNNIRPEDWVARYGGEEFLICLKRADQQAVAVVAEKLRGEVENHPFAYGEAAINLTSSFGVYSSHNEASQGCQELIAKADRNLYQAKNLGRNRIAG